MGKVKTGGAREGKEGGREVGGERREKEEGGGARGGKRREGGGEEAGREGEGVGPTRSPRALGPHAGFRALACRSISALPGLPAATSPCRLPLSLLPPSLPPFLARSWPGRAPPRAAVGRTRASGKPLGRRGRSAHGAGQVRGALGAPRGKPREPS